MSAPTRAQRYRQIAAVLGKHGIASIGAPSAAQAEQFRMACEELGTTFIKLGQLLSTRGDVLPDEFRDELAKLQDAVPPLPADVIEVEIAAELGAPVTEIFAEFNPEPLASASIGQVHAARLKDGRDVVVKVRKPGTRELVEIDLDILRSLVSNSSKHLAVLEAYDLHTVVAEFHDSLLAELDYTREARNMQAFADFFADDSSIVLPEIIWELSTARILTQTRLSGIAGATVMQLTVKQREALAQRIARFVLEPAFLHGIFHADPHAGNILPLEKGRLGVVDFGMVGRLTDDLQRYIADLFDALNRRDAQRFADRLIDIAPPTRPINRVALTQEIGRIFERYLSRSLARIEIGDALGDLLGLVRTHGLHLPGSVTMLFRAIAMSEGMIVSIAPAKTLQDFLAPLSDKIVAERLSPDHWAERLQHSAMDAAELSIELPRRADRVLADVERGNLRMWARIEDLEPTLVRLERMVERVNVTLIACACIVGLSVLLLYYHPQGWRDIIGGVFWVAPIIAIAAIVRIAWSTLRRGS